MSLVHFVTAIRSATILVDSDMYRYIHEYVCICLDEGGVDKDHEEWWEG